MFISNPARNLGKADFVSLVNLGNILGLAEGVPLFRSVNVAEAEIFPQFFVAWVYRDGEPVELSYSLIGNRRQVSANLLPEDRISKKQNCRQSPVALDDGKFIFLRVGLPVLLRDNE